MLALYINIDLNILLFTGTCILIHAYIRTCQNVVHLTYISGLEHGQHTVRMYIVWSQYILFDFTCI